MIPELPDHHLVDGILILVDVTDEAEELHHVCQIAPCSLENVPQALHGHPGMLPRIQGDVLRIRSGVRTVVIDGHGGDPCLTICGPCRTLMASEDRMS